MQGDPCDGVWDEPGEEQRLRKQLTQALKYCEELRCALGDVMRYIVEPYKLVEKKLPPAKRRMITAAIRLSREEPW